MPVTMIGKSESFNHFRQMMSGNTLKKLLTMATNFTKYPLEMTSIVIPLRVEVAALTPDDQINWHFELPEVLQKITFHFTEKRLCHFVFFTKQDYIIRKIYDLNDRKARNRDILKLQVLSIFHQCLDHLQGMNNMYSLLWEYMDPMPLQTKLPVEFWQKPMAQNIMMTDQANGVVLCCVCIFFHSWQAWPWDTASEEDIAVHNVSDDHLANCKKLQN